MVATLPKWSWPMREKDEKARELVGWHFEFEPDLVVVFRIIGDDEANPAEPIKRLVRTSPHRDRLNRPS
jgi:hypothetical protein